MKLGKTIKYCSNCGKKIDIEAEICPKCGVRQHTMGVSGKKSRIATAIFAFFLGGFGIHKFYLGKTGQGILYLLFIWTFIPSLIAFIEGIIYLTMSDEDFRRKYE